MRCFDNKENFDAKQRQFAARIQLTALTQFEPNMFTLQSVKIERNLNTNRKSVMRPQTRNLAFNIYYCVPFNFPCDFSPKS